MCPSNLWPRSSRSGRLQRELRGAELIQIKTHVSPSSTTSHRELSCGQKLRPTCRRHGPEYCAFFVIELERRRAAWKLIIREKVGASFLRHFWERWVQTQARINVANLI